MRHAKPPDRLVPTRRMATIFMTEIQSDEAPAWTLGIDDRLDIRPMRWSAWHGMPGVDRLGGAAQWHNTLMEDRESALT